MSLLSPISNKIQEITEFREKNRRSEYFNHLSAISESIAALGKNLLVAMLEIYSDHQPLYFIFVYTHIATLLHEFSDRKNLNQYFQISHIIVKLLCPKTRMTTSIS